jgi:tetraacyldisaccharide 4'-kinase
MRRPVLLPLVPLYVAGSALRNLGMAVGCEKVRALFHPVISIGNLSTGGAGKTPLAITLARLLTARGLQIDVLSRGYGRKTSGPAQVHLDGNAEQFGDEPLLIAREAGVPVFVAQKRYQAGRLAEAEIHHLGGQTRVHLLDDGFQHRQLFRDIDILLLDRNDWHDHLLPAGNLREGLRSIKRADVLAIPADDPGFEEELRKTWSGPLWRLRRSMDTPHVSGPVVAFCGIARPAQFLAGLKSAGLSLADEVIFSDHHHYSINDVERLISLARKVDAVALITTEKDEVRLGNFVSDFPASMPLETASLHVKIEEEGAAMTWLAEELIRTHAARAHRNISHNHAS